MTHASQDPHGEKSKSMRIVFREADASRCRPGRNRLANSQKSSVAAANQPPKLVRYEKSRLAALASKSAPADLRASENSVDVVVKFTRPPSAFACSPIVSA